MKVLIIEDERPAASRLEKMIKKIQPDCEILDKLDSVESSAKWLEHFNHPDLIFADIQLADGISFEIFNKVDVKAPVIFTTAYDEYTLKAFKVNSVDYLLKPIDERELATAITKFQELHKSPSIDTTMIKDLLSTIDSETKKKKRFLVKRGQQLDYINAEEVSFYYSEDGLTFASVNGNRVNIDHTLDELDDMLSDEDFHRVNRKMIVGLTAIKKIHTYFNNRLKLELNPHFEDEVIVSRDRVSGFKSWLNS